MKQTYVIKQVLDGFNKLWSIVGVFVTLYLTLFAGYYFVFIFSLILAALTLAYRAVDINFAKNTYRNYIWILGYKMGTEKPLPVIRYILVKDTTFYTRDKYMGVKSYDYYYEVSLVCEGKVKIPMLYSYDPKEVKELIRLTAHRFRLNMEDLTKEKLLSLSKH